MTFTAPLFLLAAAAAAIPVILHMINRRRAKELPFSTLRFLKISVEKTRRRKRIHDLLLMLLRSAVLVLVAAGLAKPTVSRLDALWGGGHSAVAIILDNSASMGMIDQEQMRLATAKAAAIQILKELKDGDQVVLFTAGGPAFSGLGALQHTQEQILQILPLCQVSYEKADLAPLLYRARQLLALSKAANQYIYIITDMQKVSWEESGEEKPVILSGAKNLSGEESDHEESGHASEILRSAQDDLPTSRQDSKVKPPADQQAAKIPVVIVNCNRNPKPDVALTDFDVRAAIPVAGLPASASVQLLNASTEPQSAVVELYVDGALRQSSPALQIPPGERLNYVFTLTFKRGGLHRCEARLAGEDGSKFDDRRFAALEVNQGIPVALVQDRQHEIPYLDDAYYLEKALAAEQNNSWALQTAALTAEALEAEPLANYRVIFCVNLPALSPKAAQRLRDYVAAGGNVVWIAGENVDPEAYNRMNERAGGRLLPAPLADVRTPDPRGPRDAWHLRYLDKKFPPFLPFQEPAELYESVLVYKQVRMAIADGGVRVLARLDDEEPLLAMRKVEEGWVLFWGTGMHVNWTNFPLRKIFLPMLIGLTLELASSDQAVHRMLAGEPIMLSFENTVRPLDLEVVPPSGETIRLKTQAEQGRPGHYFRYPDTHSIGVYTLRILEGEREDSPHLPERPATNLRSVPSFTPMGTVPLFQIFSVNFDPQEADPQTIDQTELPKLLGAAPLIFTDAPDDLSSTFTRLREGKSLWGLFLSGVLLALVFETYLSNQLSPKK
jgi:hypothetical protein